jgi:hypothetical protein
MLTMTSEHALRALTRLALLPEGSSMLGRELAEQAAIPANYLSKILWTLENAVIIDATRGNRGGIGSNAMPPKSFCSMSLSCSTMIVHRRPAYLEGKRVRLG